VTRGCSRCRATSEAPTSMARVAPDCTWVAADAPAGRWPSAAAGRATSPLSSSAPSDRATSNVITSVPSRVLERCSLMLPTSSLTFKVGARSCRQVAAGVWLGGLAGAARTYPRGLPTVHTVSRNLHTPIRGPTTRSSRPSSIVCESHHEVLLGPRCGGRPPARHLPAPLTSPAPAPKAPPIAACRATWGERWRSASLPTR